MKGLLFAVAATIAASADSDRPHVVVHKDILAASTPYLVKGQTFRAVYTVSEGGESGTGLCHLISG